MPANQRSAQLDGLEFNVQHMFGETGFGVSANYTLVDSGLTYDNHNRGDQFALDGLSDSANLVAFYENDKWSRCARPTTGVTSSWPAASTAPACRTRCTSRLTASWT